MLHEGVTKFNDHRNLATVFLANCARGRTIEDDGTAAIADGFIWGSHGIRSSADGERMTAGGTCCGIVGESGHGW